MTSEPILFDLPESEEPETGLPDKIVHGCDYMLGPNGELEFHYNFLVYTWTVAGQVVSARAYLDERFHEVSVFVQGARLRTDPALRALVRYLQRRFSSIQSFHADDAAGGGTGYAVQFRSRNSSDPN